jgi:hypothetical protein
MKKITKIVIIGLFVINAVSAAVSSYQPTQTISINLSFSQPVFTNENTVSTIKIENAPLQLQWSGYPLLPKYVKVYDLPFASKKITVDITFDEIFEEVIKYPLRCASQPLPLLVSKYPLTINERDPQESLDSQEFFPQDWYKYQVTCGLSSTGNHVTHVVVSIYPVRYLEAENRIVYIKDATLTITYKAPFDTFMVQDDYDLLLIAPSRFSNALQPLITHKNEHNMKTILFTTETIYRKYEGVDKPEKIKYCVKNAIEEYDIKYVLLVGGLKHVLFATDRENENTGSRAWHVPVRYTNLYDTGNHYDPGYLSDLYYADIYDGSGEFSSWDPNEDGIFAAWGKPDVPKDVGIDLDPDVYVGRLACRNILEVKTMVNKIIAYETSQNTDWFHKMIVISGDGFQDQDDLAKKDSHDEDWKIPLQWDVSTLPEGTYTIYAQSKNPQETVGLIDTVNVTVSHTDPSNITFCEDDHLKITSYPGLPIAEITSPSEGDILGTTNVLFTPKNAYIGSEWATVQYQNNVMYIRGKSYDPRPHASTTYLKVYITNNEGDIVKDFGWIQTLGQFYEGERETWKALEYMPDNVEKILLWTSNGKLTGQDEVIEEISKGAGFVYFAGHGSPRVWANHYPGIPGGRKNASVEGLNNFNYNGFPFFPMNKLTNGDKLPVFLVGGCHNSQFNVTIFKTMFGPFMGYWTYGIPIAECWSWTLTRLSKGGAIATIGCTGLGYGVLGEQCTERLGGWINPEFFRIVAEKIDAQEDIYLGNVHTEAIANYIALFSVHSQKVDCKTVQEWALLGDPSLKIGGYAH